MPRGKNRRVKKRGEIEFAFSRGRALLNHNPFCLSNVAGVPNSEARPVERGELYISSRDYARIRGRMTDGESSW